VLLRFWAFLVIIQISNSQWIQTDINLAITTTVTILRILWIPLLPRQSSQIFACLISKVALQKTRAVPRTKRAQQHLPHGMDNLPSLLQLLLLSLKHVFNSHAISYLQISRIAPKPILKTNPRSSTSTKYLKYLSTAVTSTTTMVAYKPPLLGFQDPWSILLATISSSLNIATIT